MILAANFKMNHTRASTRAYLQKLESIDKGDVALYLFPPFTALDDYDTAVATIGAQNAYCAQNGSYTGEIGLEQLEEFGIKTLILGHSERRHLFGENQDLIAKKFTFFKERGFTIFYCVGETQEVRESGSKELIYSYIEQQLEGIDVAYEKLIVAYEPVWAIGTGKTATTEDIATMLEFLRTKTKRPLLYGGSVKPQNIAQILQVPECEGALIGTASWNVDTFMTMINIAKEL
ncbi:triosephosphate isomerase [Nitratiruptor sp. YY08-26]|uniref:triose-phosphate isomerase n=1 Tax=unclassified Nitratiruptor TaxID=2624044 RepID=UPI001916066B|nr:MULTISPECIES: triose-phosphate isomerase [unclassified Nitratiruptor]BCD62772.1 triosephosphate isomerase [Nitratiruptor sp. YY08-13]BCD66708.1 triosephosphate isomerase [Nitratiruptor sp. YY08-26]